MFQNWRKQLYVWNIIRFLHLHICLFTIVGCGYKIFWRCTGWIAISVFRLAKVRRQRTLFFLKLTLSLCRDGSLSQEFLVTLFKLMPVGTLLKEDTKDSALSSMFSNNPVDRIGYEGHYGSDVIEHFACYLFRSALEQFPALIRQWWNVLDVKTSQLVEKITVFFVSPLICSSELNEVMQHQSGFKNLKVGLAFLIFLLLIIII